MFTILDYSSALEYSIIRRYTNIVYYLLLLLLFGMIKSVIKSLKIAFVEVAEFTK